MSKVLKLKIDAVNYVKPEMSIIIKCIKNINRLSLFESKELNILQVKAKSLNSYVQELDQILRLKKTSLYVSLKDIDLDCYFSNLTEIDQALEQVSIDKETKEMLFEERNNVVQNLIKKMWKLCAEFKNAVDIVNSKIECIQNIIINEKTNKTIENQEKLKQEISIENISYEKRKIEKCNDKKIIIESQEILREKNIADIFGEFIPTNKQLVSLDIKVSEKSPIKLTLSHLKKVLGNVSEGLKYSDLEEKRKSLDDEIDKLDIEIVNNRNKVEKIDQFISQISKVLHINNEKEQLIIEVNKIVQAWILFVSVMSKIIQNGHISKLIINQQIKRQKLYLEQIIE